MRSLAFLGILFFAACTCSPRSSSRPVGGPASLLDFLQAYNAYALAQLYLKRGRHAEAEEAYRQSLRQLDRLDESARTLLRQEYGLAKEQVERELAIARALAQKAAIAKGDTSQRERFRERVLAEFYPYGRGSLTQGGLGPGSRLTQANWQEAQDLLPPETLKALKEGHWNILLQETTDLPPSEAYVVATLGYGDEVRLSSEGELEGYTAGLPFPALDPSDPQAGLKAAWNLRYRDAGDRLEQWGDLLVRNPQGETQYALSSYYARACGMYRAQSQDNVPEWEKSGIVCKEYTEVFTPPVLGHTAGVNPVGQLWLALRYRYSRDRRPMGQWSLTPQSRKVKTAGYDPERSALGTMIFEDVVGSQISTHHWRLVAHKAALVPGFTRDYEVLFGGKGGGYPLGPWELRYVYLLETTPRSPHHPYGRKLLYVDQQTWAPLYVAIFDPEGHHWRTIFFSYGHPRFDPQNSQVQVPILLGQSWIDHRTQRATVLLVRKARYNQDLNPGLFSLSSLMQRGK